MLTSLMSERPGRLAGPGSFRPRSRAGPLLTGSARPTVADRIALVHGYEGEVGVRVSTPRV